MQKILCVILLQNFQNPWLFAQYNVEFLMHYIYINLLFYRIIVYHK
jgi:hypothetical protein